MLGQESNSFYWASIAWLFSFRFLLRIRLNRKTAAIFRWTSRSRLRRYWREWAAKPAIMQRQMAAQRTLRPLQTSLG